MISLFELPLWFPLNFRVEFDGSKNFDFLKDDLSQSLRNLYPMYLIERIPRQLPFCILLPNFRHFWISVWIQSFVQVALSREFLFVPHYLICPENYNSIKKYRIKFAFKNQRDEILLIVKRRKSKFLRNSIEFQFKKPKNFRVLFYLKNYC